MLLPPPWLQEVVRLTSPNVHPQIQVVLEAYARAPDDACPFVNPTLECGDCGTRVMLHQGPRLRAEWWEVAGCHHSRDHSRCEPRYAPHSAKRCREERALSGRSPFPWLLG